MIVDIHGHLFKPKKQHGISSVWSDTHLKRSEIFNFQLRQVMADNLHAWRWVKHISGETFIDLTTTFYSLTRERAR